MPKYVKRPRGKSYAPEYPPQDAPPGKRKLSSKMKPKRKSRY